MNKESDQAIQNQQFPLWEKIVGVVFGFIFIAAVLAITVSLKDLNPEQYAIIKIVLALAVAGIAGVFSGFIEISCATQVYWTLNDLIKVVAVTAMAYKIEV